jgi:predicted DNA-binding transcriptional regulator
MTNYKYLPAVNILNNSAMFIVDRYNRSHEKVRYKLNRLYRDGVLERTLLKGQFGFTLKKTQPKLTSLNSKIKHTEKKT